MRFLVIGAGKQGSACALDLLLQPQVEKVLMVDRSFDHLPDYLKPHRDDPRLELRKLDLRDSAAVRDALAGVQSVLSAAPYYFNGELARLAVEAGVHFADLGGNTEIVIEQLKLDAAARAKGVTVIPDCGLAPGMVNVLAGEGIRRLDTTESVKIYVGGLPQQPEPPLNYMVVYSLEGALDYYTTPSWVLRGGKRTRVDALSELELVEFPAPIGQLEAFHTGGGISTMPFDYEGKIPVMEYKTLRYPGHVAIMRPIRELGLLDTKPVTVDGCEVVPRKVFIEVVSPKLTRKEGRDLVALRVDVVGTKGGTRAGWRWQLVDRYDEQRGVTAMMRTTGYSLSVTGLMQVDGRIERKGAFAPNQGVPAAPYVAELARRGIVIEETEIR
ncbi:MAG TPA: saccharopine dehydrogenase C-terminal domain-containing protein [Gemmatimonadales bacterium]|nr:saccharopine dehydrogenase C-terminal domain-containing protein [Gemmatimonadales bacterium]